VPGAIAAIFAAIHSGFHMSSSQSASHVFLCLKSRYLSFVYNQKSRLSWSAMYSPHPTRQKYHQNRKSALRFSPSAREFCQSILPFTYLLQPISSIPPVQRIWKEFLPKRRPWQD
jgi:hypothetical protein